MTDNFIFAANAVGPLILLILLGFFLRKIQFLPKSFFDQGNRLVFKILIPCSTFCSIYSCPGLSNINLSFMAYGAGIASVLFIAGLVTTHLFVKEPESWSAAHQAAFRSNIPVLGSALALALAGTEGEILIATFMMVIIPLLNIFAVMTLMLHPNTSGKRQSLSSLLLGIVKNPLIIACIVGFAVLAVRQLLTPPGGTAVFTLRDNLPFLFKAVSSLAGATTPVSLVVLGGLVDFSVVGGRLGNIVFGVVWKLVAAPVLAIAGVLVLGSRVSFGAPEYAALLATFGSSIATASAPMTAEMGGDAELSRQYVVWTNVFLMVSMPLEIVVMRSVGML